MPNVHVITYWSALNHNFFTHSLALFSSRGHCRKRKQFTATEKKYNVVYERFVCFLTVPPSLLDRAIACKSSVDLSLSKLHSDTVYFYHLILQVEQAFISLMCVSCFSAVSVVTVKCWRMLSDKYLPVYVSKPERITAVAVWHAQTAAGLY